MLDYDTFKEKIFRVVGQQKSSVSVIKNALNKLAEDFNIPYSIVVVDFNEYNGYMWDINE